MSNGNVYEGISGIHISFLESMANLQYERQNSEKEHFEYASEEADEYKKQVITFQIEKLLLIKGCIDGGNIDEVSEIVRKVVLNMEELILK
ncbi:MAG: hypothetical protein ACERKZ_12655 [Lachnotalea sp.]